jgi:hypothetical protein
LNGKGAEVDQYRSSCYRYLLIVTQVICITLASMPFDRVEGYIIMPFKLEKLPDEPILMVSIVEPFDVKADYIPFTNDLLDLLDRTSEPVYAISDSRSLKLSFAEMVSMLGIVTRGDEAKRLEKHPKIRAWLIVVENELLRMGANALGQAQYGGNAIPLFRTVEEALDYARRLLASDAGKR